MRAVFVVPRRQWARAFAHWPAKRLQGFPHGIGKIIRQRELLAKLLSKGVFEVAFHPCKHIRRSLVPARAGNKPLWCFTIAQVLIRAVRIVQTRLFASTMPRVATQSINVSETGSFDTVVFDGRQREPGTTRRQFVMGSTYHLIRCRQPTCIN